MYKSAGGREAQLGEVVEVLRQLNPLMEDAVTAECNMGTFHRHMIRTGLPTVTWGMLYQGIPQSKSTTQQVDDTTGFVEGLSTVDTRLLDISPNPAAVRLNEARGYLEAMAQEVQKGFFYHDTSTTPERFKGLAARYSKIGGGGAGNQIVNAGGSGSDNTSIWFVTHGDAKADLPVIIVTADTAVDLRDRCLAAGADEVMFKPVAMDSLFDAIGRMLAKPGGHFVRPRASSGEVTIWRSSRVERSLSDVILDRLLTTMDVAVDAFAICEVRRGLRLIGGASAAVEVSTLGVLIGVLLAIATGYTRLDSILAALVGVTILWSGWQLIRESVIGLMDVSV
eukprot:gene36703-49471_t